MGGVPLETTMRYRHELGIRGQVTRRTVVRSHYVDYTCRLFHSTS